jgi:hypothetical protein
VACSGEAKSSLACQPVQIGEELRAGGCPDRRASGL